MDGQVTLDPHVVRIPSNGGAILEADLQVPHPPSGIVVFAHGSGSSRFSRRNRAVAAALAERDFATLLLDLLTAQEESDDQHTLEYRFDIGLLGRRLVDAVEWVRMQPQLDHLPIALFGSSTGAAAALVAAAERPQLTHAVISRGGRPDLAGEALHRVEAPTLLIVGSRDEPVIEMNRDAMRRMRAHVEIEIVPGASHLFEERGALEQVAELAAGWCQRYLWSMA